MRFNIKKILVKGILCLTLAMGLVGGTAAVGTQIGGTDVAYASEHMTVQLEKTKMSLVSKTTTSIKVKWTDVKYADKYKIKIYKGDSSKVYKSYTFGKSEAKVLTLKNLNSATEYRYKITASANKKGSVEYISSVREYSCHTSIKTPVMKSVKSSNGTIKVDWNDTMRADGYYLYRKIGSGSYKKIATVKGKSSYTDSNLTQSAKYRYKVKAYYKCCGYNRSSSCSSSKSVSFSISKAAIINNSTLKPMKTNRASLDKKVDCILDSILTKNMTKYEKLKAIYRYTYKNIYYKFPDYPYKTYPYVSSHDKTVVVQAELALKNKYGVCNDYAAVFQVLARRAGFEVYTVNSSAYWGGQWDSHSWNMVRVSGKWYRVDTQIQRLKSGKDTDYTFFMQTDKTDWGVTYPTLDKQSIVDRFGGFKLKNGKKSC